MTATPFPLTDLQEAYLVGTSELVDLGGFWPHFYLELDVVGLAVERLADAVAALVARHEQLRTVVAPGGGQVVLAAADLGGMPVPVHDLRDLAPGRAEAAIAQVRDRMAGTGHDPAVWPLFAVEASRLRTHRTRVHLAMSLLLLDAHSTWQLLGEAWRLCARPEDPLPPVQLTVRQWRELLAERHRAREHWPYWGDRLDSLPEAPALPLAGPLARLGPVRLTQRRCELGAAEWAGLVVAARRQRVLPAAALAHAFAETLGAWAAGPRFCLNMLHEGWRGRHPEWAGVVGNLGATLPVEVDLGRDEGYWDRARRLQGQLWRDLEHSDVTAVEIMRAVAARRSWSSQPALPYVFNGMLGSGPRTPRPAAVPVASALRTPHVLIDNQVQDAPGGGVVCTWYVVDAAFPAGLPDVMFDAYTDLVRGLATAEEPVIGLARHRARVAAVNDTAGPLPAGRLEDGFMRSAASRPDATALVTPARTMSYAELERAAATVAGRLRWHGVGRGDIVPVVLRKGWEQVVAVLAVLRCGAAYCPVDAGLPAERIRQLLDQCAPRVVIATTSRSLPADLGRPVVELDRTSWVGMDEPGRRPGDGEPTDLAYVIHTSGSTGTPKGVLIEHRSALNTVLDVNQRIGLGPADRVFGVSSLSFDLSVWDVFGTLAAGATLVLPRASAAPEPTEWLATAAEHGVTVWNSVPALAELLTEEAEHASARDRPPLRAVLLSGDWVPPTLPDRMRSVWGSGLRVLALGGATEASIWSNAFEVDRVDAGWRSIPYGIPLRNQRMTVLDHRMRVRAPWATGAIYIGGVGLARGYLGDHATTAERFVSHPETGERLYCTGDLGRYWPDGTIEFLGREDRQLKIRGFRIEPGEVESVLRRCPGVTECAVGADRGPDGAPRLAALVVGSTDGPDELAIRAFLSDRLPHYMVPARLHLVEALPLTPNGKVDLAAGLRIRPDQRVAAAPMPLTDPRAELLRQLWADLLERPDVGPDDNFFTLGGSSLLALRLMHRLRAELDLDVSLGVIFEAPTVRALADRLRSAEPGAVGVPLKDGSGPLLVLFHPVGGSVRCYGELVRTWPGPVHGCQSPLLDAGPCGGPAGLEALAADYRAELDRLDHVGRPIVLAGWSMGGVLAHEVGRQLAAEGRCPTVVMIDSTVPGSGSEPSRRPGYLEFLTDLAGGRLPAAVRSVDSAQVARDVAVGLDLLPAGSLVADVERLAAVHGRNLELLAAYRPGPSPVPTLLFVATKAHPADPVPAWRALCADLKVVRWAVDHHGIVAEDRLADVGTEARRWLAGRASVALSRS
ncbi:MAG TPA: amino acid adenylation domain-containing protein [Jatrophihabitans sp.]|nr:amino acid adenylation domain-containing protein [Jatrophihabitans sp.]